MQPVKPRVVQCPACGTPVEWIASSRYRPFCSARCKEADIGAWASERYRVAGGSPSSDESGGIDASQHAD